MTPPIIELIGMLGRVGLKIMNEIDDPSIDKRQVRNAMKIVEIIDSIPRPDGFIQNQDTEWDV